MQGSISNQLGFCFKMALFLYYCKLFHVILIGPFHYTFPFWSNKQQQPQANINNRLILVINNHLLHLIKDIVTLETDSGLDLISERNRCFFSTTGKTKYAIKQESRIVIEQNTLVSDRTVEHAVLLGHYNLIPHNKLMRFLELNTSFLFYMISIEGNHHIGVDTASVVIPVFAQICTKLDSIQIP